MSDIGLQNIQQESIENLLKEYQNYEIPFFQREYSWTKDEWIDFLDDAIKSKEGNLKHFFGFMTFRKETEDKISIIEGQQRLTTVVILLCLVRDIFNEFDDIYWKTIENFITLEDPFSPYEPSSPKLILSDLNRDFFQNYIQSVNKPKDKIQEINSLPKINLSNKYIFECYKHFNFEINKRIKNLSVDEKKDFLRELLKAVLRNFIIIKTDVTNNKAAFNIFQTLNDRGLDLTITDLIKVYLFGLVGSGWEQAKDKWDDIREILSDQNSNSFFRHFWLSKYSIVKEKELLNEIEKNVNTKSEVYKFLDELKNEAEYYDALLNPSKGFWEKRSDEIVELLQELQVLSKQQPMPVLMASCKESKFPTNEFIKLLKMCIIFIFRYLTIAERENKELERLFSEIAIDIRKGKISDTREIKERFLKEDVDDESFISIFANKQIKSIKVAKYILMKIENKLSGQNEKVYKRITLEHVLPKSPNKEWNEYLKNNIMDKNEHIHKIGNMTLLLQKPNKDAQSHYFLKKRDEIYIKETKLKINDDLKEISSWNINDIIHRQKKLAEIAADVWKL